MHRDNAVRAMDAAALHDPAARSAYARTDGMRIGGTAPTSIRICEILRD